MMNELFSVQDAVAVVTGGLGQLGRAYVEAFVDAGARVCVVDRPEAGADALAKVFGSRVETGRLMYARCDVTNRSDLEAALAAIQARWGAPTVLVNNAALDSPPNAPQEETGPFESYPEESWDKVMDVNVKGVFLCCQVFGGAMAEAGGGSIINISSIYGAVSPNQSIYEYRRQRGETFYKPVAYAASKSALFNLTRYLATYWAAKNVRVNVVVLAGVFNNQDADFMKAYLEKMPIGRMATPQDYVGPILFLASPASTYMTGSTITVDGGWTAW